MPPHTFIVLSIRMLHIHCTHYAKKHHNGHSTYISPSHESQCRTVQLACGDRWQHIRLHTQAHNNNRKSNLGFEPFAQVKCREIILCTGNKTEKNCFFHSMGVNCALWLLLFIHLKIDMNYEMLKYHRNVERAYGQLHLNHQFHSTRQQAKYSGFWCCCCRLHTRKG